MHSIFQNQQLLFHLKEIDNKKKFLLKIENKTNIAILVLEKANWETSVLKKRCLKIIFLYFSNLKIGNDLLKKFKQFIKKENYFWTQIDDKNIFPKNKKITNFLLRKGFELSNKYLFWEMKKKDLNKKLLKSTSNRIKFKIAKKNNIGELKNFTKKYPFPGRYVLKKKFRKYGIKLYSSWVSNSVISKNQKVYFYKENNNIESYQAINFDYKEKIMILGILRNSKKIPTLGTFALLNSLRKFMINNKVNFLQTKSSLFNNEINKINYLLGMRVKYKGINLEYFNK